MAFSPRYAMITPVIESRPQTNDGDCFALAGSQ
jgi:hypothetical protein